MNPATEQSGNFPRPLGAARATLAAFDAMAAPLTRAIEQSERELGIVREHQASERRVLAEADEVNGTTGDLPSGDAEVVIVSANLLPEADPSKRPDRPTGEPTSALVQGLRFEPVERMTDFRTTLGDIVALADRMELHDRRPSIRFLRDGHGFICGVELVQIVEAA